MASSSSQPTGRWTYDVFISFRGEDTRLNFVDHLYKALDDRGILAFKDNLMLPRGELISTELLKAIEGSRFAVVVFSKNYANSSWCLDELAKIMECKDLIGQTVLPVFYHVKPSDLRRLKRNFGTAFQQHEEKFMGEVEKLNKWREALVTASGLGGWHISKSGNEGESKFINKIVQEILGGIQPHGMETNLIGMEYHIDQLNSLLCTKATEEVRVIGIWGMGGIGKTTIAQAVFQRISYKFDGSSFVEDVKRYRKSDTWILENQIQSNIFKFQVLDHGANTTSTRFSNKRVLLVVDDVDDDNQLEFLTTRQEWFCPGSRIIITTRNKQLLPYGCFIYEPNCLRMDQALELFSRHAFQKSSPPEAYTHLSYRAISYTGYLPLALKVLGSFFRGRPTSVWGSALNRLTKAPHTKIFETLKLSFDGLEVSEKNIFLDIACFFKGKDKEHVTRILDCFGFDAGIGISVLIDKSLVTDSNKKLGMHDLIQEMGWRIVRESFSNSRLWEPEKIHDIIKSNTKLKAVEAIVLPDKECEVGQHGERRVFHDKVFRRMKNLRLLDVFMNCTSHEPTLLPHNLRWLSWQGYLFSSLPVEHMHKLVGLEMSNGFIKHLWKGQKILPNLKFVDLRHMQNLRKFPDVSAAPNIERLILSGCCSLVEVHESLGFHKMLAYLDMSGCKQLKCLPSRIKMKSLDTLILSDCKNLERFPEVSPCIEKLSNIYLDYCIQIKELPSSMRYLSGLMFLNLIGCKNFKNIPKSICELKHLKSLLLHNCKRLQKLPEELGSMENLEELLLGFTDNGNLRKSISCRTLTSLCSLKKLDLSWRQIEEGDFPQNFHAFSSLEELNLSGNSRLTQLPDGISHLSRLKLLELNMCCRLQNLHALPSRIQVLRARGCSSLEKIGDLSQEDEWLYKVWFIDCHKLLQDQENGQYIDKMLQQSFLKKCATVDHRLSIVVPGSKIPSWFKEQQHGCDVALRLPPKLDTQVMGFAICGVFHDDWQYDCPRIVFRIVNDEKDVSMSEVDTAASEAADYCNLLVTYIPFGFFQQMYPDLRPQDWSHIEGNLVMTIMRTDGNKSVRCGAHVVYKEDIELIQQLKTGISDYGNLVKVKDNDDLEELGYERKISGNTYVYEEKFDKRDSNLMPLRTRTSQIHVYNRSFATTFHNCASMSSQESEGRSGGLME